MNAPLPPACRLSACLAVLLVTCAGMVPAAAREPKTRDLTELSVEELANLEVTTAGRKPENRSRVAAAIYVITPEDIRRSGAGSLPEALRLAPGVTVARIAANQWSIGMRGFTSRLSRSMLVLMDGRSVYTPLFAGVYWEVQDTLLQDIERIEVVRGPGGTLWGSNAVNGIVNVITKPAEQTQGLLMEAGGGSSDQGFGAFRYGGRVGATGAYRIYGKTFSRNAFFGAGDARFDDGRMGQAGFRADWKRASDTLVLQGDSYAGAFGERVDITSYVPPLLSTAQADADVSGGNLLARWSRALSAGSELSLQSYFDHTHRSEPNFREDRETFDLSLQHRARLWEDNELNWGAGYRVSSGDFRGVPTVAFTPARRTDQLFSGFAQDEIALAKRRLWLTLGSKLEHNDYSGVEVQPSGRLLWNISERQGAWIAATRAVRTPSRIEHDVVITALLQPSPLAFARFLGTRQFISEKLYGYEAGYRAQLTSGLSLDAAVFFDDYHDLLSVEPRAPFSESAPGPAHTVAPLFLLNGMTGKTYGAELALDAQLARWWRLSGSYSHLRLTLTPKPGSLDRSTKPSTEGSSPRNQVELRSFTNLSRSFELDLLFRYIGELPAQGIRGYASGDARLGWRAGRRLEFSVIGQNLLQPRHAEFSGGGSFGTLEVPRAVYAKVTWRH